MSEYRSCVSYLREKLAGILTAQSIYQEDRFFLRSMNRMLLDAIHRYGEDTVTEACEVVNLQDYLKQLNIISQL